MRVVINLKKTTTSRRPNLTLEDKQDKRKQCGSATWHAHKKGTLKPR